MFVYIGGDLSGGIWSYNISGDSVRGDFVRRGLCLGDFVQGDYVLDSAQLHPQFGTMQ